VGGPRHRLAMGSALRPRTRPAWGPRKYWGKTEVCEVAPSQNDPKEVTQMVTDRKKDSRKTPGKPLYRISLTPTQLAIDCFQRCRFLRNASAGPYS
jgi:hypothetical protein